MSLSEVYGKLVSSNWVIKPTPINNLRSLKDKEFIDLGNVEIGSYGPGHASYHL